MLKFQTGHEYLRFTFFALQFPQLFYNITKMLHDSIRGCQLQKMYYWNHITDSTLQYGNSSTENVNLRYSGPKWLKLKMFNLCNPLALILGLASYLADTINIQKLTMLEWVIMNFKSDSSLP